MKRILIILGILLFLFDLSNDGAIGAHDVHYHFNQDYCSHCEGGKYLADNDLLHPEKVEVGIVSINSACLPIPTAEWAFKPISSAIPFQADVFYLSKSSGGLPF
jgi:hypothetical protein